MTLVLALIYSIRSLQIQFVATTAPGDRAANLRRLLLQ